MSQNVKPTDFTQIIPDLNTEMYTQTGGVNGKFTISDIFDLIPQEATRTEEYFDSASGTTVTLNNNPIFMVVLVNGQIQRNGLNRDYTYSGNIITFYRNLDDDDVHVVYVY